MEEDEQALLDTTIAVLREHVAFLREQLNAKAQWHEGLLEEAKERIAVLERKVDFQAEYISRLRVYLSEAATVGECDCTPDEKQTGRWCELLREWTPCESSQQAKE